MAVLQNSFFYDADPTRVWALVTDFKALENVCQRFLSFEGLPEGRLETGQSFDVMVRLFGRLPAQPYHMEVELCDDAAMQFQSREKGAGVTQWDHHLWVQPERNGTRLRETITIKAGLATPLFLLWARLLYRGRHAPRVDLLKSGAF